MTDSTTHPTILVVSGLPRSGTSLAMQMLHAGGVPVVVDGERASDDDNPRGYFEDARTLRLWDDASWLDDAVGKAIKIVVPLLRALPFVYDFRVLLMERELSEVMASQATMLRRQAGDDRRLAAFGQLVESLAWFKRWVRYQPNFRCLEVSYRCVLESPAEQVARIAGFLERELDHDAMVSVVDRSMYRQRS
jgi:hypothetical protein